MSQTPSSRRTGTALVSIETKGEITRSSAVCVSWFREEDYGRVLAIMEDRDTLPETFDAWERIAEARFAKLQLQNAAIRRVIVEPAALLDFCAEHDIALDWHAQALYAALVAEGAFQIG